MTFDVNFKVLHGSSVRLEPIDESHVEGLFTAGQSHDDWAYLPIPGFHEMDDAKAWVGQAVQLLESGLHYTYVLVEPGSGDIMGSSRYLNVRHKDAALEIGYTWLGRKYQRTSVNTEAKLLLLTNAFENMGANRVELKTDLRNAQSQKAIERIGAKKEGVLRMHMVTQGGYVRDTVMYSIIAPEWDEIKRNLLNRIQNYA